tara:strand:- start:310 stop:3111 length:2802 start_codon:yes stop_codon:yes gene_type:complete
MADRFPLIIDSVDQQIQELSSGDNLDLASSGVVNANLVHSSGVNVGVVTATKFKGDGSELDNLPASGGTLEATASGTLADGSKVIVNADGTVSVVAQDETTGAGDSGATVFANHNTDEITAVFDSNSNRVVILYRVNDGSPGKGSALVGEISGGSVTFGSPVDFDTDEVTTIDAAFDSTNNKVVVGYRKYASDGTKYHHARVGTVDPTDNSIEFGDAEPINTNGESAYFNMIFDPSSGKIVVAFADESNSFQGTARVGTVNASNNTISFGTPLVYNSAAASTTKEMVADTSANRIVLVSTDAISGSYKTVARVGTITGTSISFSSPQEIYASGSSNTGVGFDASTNKVVVVYQNNNQAPDAYRLNTLVGTVNAGTNTIAFGSRQTLSTYSGINKKSVVYDSGSQKILFVYRNGNNSWIEEYRYATVNGGTDTITLDSATVLNTVDNGYAGAVYDSNANQALIHYQDYSNSRYGTYHVVGLSGFPVPEVGSEKVFSSATTYYTSAAYDSTNNKVVIAYMDMGDNGYGKAVVGTVSGTSISFGTPVTFNSGQSSFISVVYDSTNQRVVIAYRDSTAPSYTNYGTAIVGEVDPNDNSIDFGTPVTFNTTNTEYISATYDSTNSKVVIAYLNTVLNHGQGIVGTVDPTDNSIEFGPAQSFETAPSNYISAVFDSTNGKVVIAYSDQYDNNYGKVAVGTFNGSTITFGVPVTTFNSSNTDALSAVYDPSSQKVVVIYRDAGNSYVSSAIVGEVSGTGNSISFPSSAVTFNSFSGTQLTPVYDPDNQNIVLIYRNGSNSSYGTALLMTVSGTSISFGSSTVFNAANTYYISATYDSSNKKVVISYADYGNSQYATAITFSSRTISNNLTSENFIGISNGAYSDGETATIQIAGAVDDAQSGLTPGQQYYVQNDGTLSETADSPSVLAGTAVAATKLIIG